MDPRFFHARSEKFPIVMSERMESGLFVAGKHRTVACSAEHERTVMNEHLSAEPTRLGQTPPRAPWLIAIAASAGGIRAIETVLAALPQHLPAAIVIVLHRTTTQKSYLDAVLRRHSPMPVVMAMAGQLILPGLVYVARPDLHLMVSPDMHFAYRDGKRIRFVLSSANPLLESAAAAFDGRVIAVVLSGGGSDATDGVQSVKAHGGIVIAQDRATSEHFGMPEAAVRSGAVDYVLPLEAIGPTVAAIVSGFPVAEGLG
jgi:two-component system chemotaxis response regulator CheB